jgi:hypothetical protein
MNRRTFTAAAVATPLMSGCLWDKYFDLTWEEEVQLHDGRIIVVKLKYTYERLQRGFTRYAGENIQRNSVITFDAGGSTGLVTQELKGGWPISLEQVDGSWHLLFYWNSGWSPSLLGAKTGDRIRTGTVSTLPYYREYRERNSMPFPSARFPQKFSGPIWLLPRDNLSETVSFSGSLLTLQAKRTLDGLPRGPYEASIERPAPRSSFACRAQVNQFQGVTT